jgi:hypothetical protein
VELKRYQIKRNVKKNQILIVEERQMRLTLMTCISCLLGEDEADDR